jgi:hypothetical protein
MNIRSMPLPGLQNTSIPSVDLAFVAERMLQAARTK